MSPSIFFNDSGVPGMTWARLRERVFGLRFSTENPKNFCQHVAVLLKTRYIRGEDDRRRSDGIPVPCSVRGDFGDLSKVKFPDDRKSKKSMHI